MQLEIRQSAANDLEEAEKRRIQSDVADLYANRTGNIKFEQLASLQGAVISGQGTNSEKLAAFVVDDKGTWLKKIDGTKTYSDKRKANQVAEFVTQTLKENSPLKEIDTQIAEFAAYARSRPKNPLAPHAEFDTKATNDSIGKSNQNYFAVSITIRDAELGQISENIGRFRTRESALAGREYVRRKFEELASRS